MDVRQSPSPDRESGSGAVLNHPHASAPGAGGLSDEVLWALLDEAIAAGLTETAAAGDATGSAPSSAAADRASASAATTTTSASDPATATPSAVDTADNSATATDSAAPTSAADTTASATASAGHIAASATTSAADIAASAAPTSAADTTTSAATSAADTSAAAGREVGPSEVVGVQAQVASLASGSAQGLSDADLLAATQAAVALEASAHALVLHLTGIADRRKSTTVLHGVGTRQWLAGLIGATSFAGASAVLRHGRRLSGAYRATDAALSQGSVSVAQADAICTALSHLPSDLAGEAVEAAESYLLGLATEEAAGPEELRREANTLIRRALPEAEDAVIGEQLERMDREADQQRRLSLYPDPLTGGVGIKGLLPAVEGQRLWEQLDAIAHRPRSGEAGVEAGDDRTLAQARADALLEISEVYGRADTQSSRGGSHPRVNVIVDATSLMAGAPAATLVDGTPIAATRARALACDATTCLIGVNRNGVPILTSTTRARYFPDDLRAAFVARDGGCAFPGCGAPPTACDAHHILPWRHGGATSLDNGVLVCPYHHRLVEPDPDAIPETRWEIRLAVDGLPEVLPPRAVDPKRRPRRHRRLAALTARNQQARRHHLPHPHHDPPHPHTE